MENYYCQSHWLVILCLVDVDSVSLLLWSQIIHGHRAVSILSKNPVMLMYFLKTARVHTMFAGLLRHQTETGRRLAGVPHIRRARYGAWPAFPHIGRQLTIFNGHLNRPMLSATVLAPFGEQTGILRYPPGIAGRCTMYSTCMFSTATNRVGSWCCLAKKTNIDTTCVNLRFTYKAHTTAPRAQFRLQIAKMKYSEKSK